MKTIVQFFFNPNKFFEKLHDGKLSNFLFKLFIAYAVVNILWGLKIDSSLDKILFPVCIDNEIVKILFSFVLDAALLLAFSVILLVIAVGLRVEVKLFTIVLSVFSLETIAVLFTLIQLLLIGVFDEKIYFETLDTIELVYCLLYLYYPIKYIFRTHFLKTFIIQIISLVAMLVCLTGSYYIYIKYGNLSKAANTDEVINYLKRHQVNDAINESSYLVREYPNNAELRYDIGEAFIMYLLLSPTQEIDNKDPMKHDRNKIYHQAEKAYIAAIQLDPKFLAARKSLGSLYYLMGQNEKAVEQFNVALGEGLNDSDIYRKMAGSYFRLKNNKLARKYYNLIPETNRSSLEKGNLFKFKIQESIHLKEDQYIDAVGVVDWKITDEMLYDLAVMSKEISEKLISSDISHVLHLMVLTDCDDGIRNNDMENISNEKLIVDVNKLLKEKGYGIEVVDVKISFTVQ